MLPVTDVNPIWWVCFETEDEICVHGSRSIASKKKNPVEGLVKSTRSLRIVLGMAYVKVVKLMLTGRNNSFKEDDLTTIVLDDGKSRTLCFCERFKLIVVNSFSLEIINAVKAAFDKVSPTTCGCHV